MKQQSVTKGFAILSLAGIAVKILSLLYIPFLLAIIGEEGNGIYAAAYQVYVLVYVVSNSGVPVAISKLVSELIAVNNYKDAVRSFKIARFLLIAVGIVMSTALFLLSAPLSRLLHFEKSYLAILALSPTLLFTSISSAYRGYFQGRRNMTPTAVSQVIEQIANTIFTLVFAALLIKYGMEAACAGGTVGTSLGALFSAVFLVAYHRKNKKFIVPKAVVKAEVKRYSYGQLFKKVINYSIPITLCIGMQYAGNLIDLWNTKVRLLAAGFPDAAATQMYSHLYKYQQLLNAPIAVVAALAATILPAISGAVAINDREQVQSKVNFAFRLCFLVTIPSAVGFSVLSDPIFKLLKYGPGSYLMLYGSAALVLLAIVQIQTSILQGAGKLYTVTFILILGIIGKITTNFFLISIPKINIVGAIIGSVVGYCIPITINLFVIGKHIGVRPRLLSLAVKPLIASVLMGTAVHFTYTYIYLLFGFLGISYLINAISVITSIPIGIFIYLTAIVLIKAVKKEDLEAMPVKFRKFIPKRVLDRME